MVSRFPIVLVQGGISLGQANCRRHQVTEIAALFKTQAAIWQRVVPKPHHSVQWLRERHLLCVPHGIGGQKSSQSGKHQWYLVLQLSMQVRSRSDQAADVASAMEERKTKVGSNDGKKLGIRELQ